MTVSLEIKISERLYEQAKSAAAAGHRSVEEQLAFWAELGREALNHPELTVRLLEVALAAEVELVDADTEHEQLNRLWAALRDRK